MYGVDDVTVAKLYRPDRLTTPAVRKLELMVGTPVADARLAWPTGLVEDEQGRVLGYVMPRASGRPLQRSIFIRPLLETYFPRWTRLELVDLSLTLLDAFAALHRQGVLVGDVNGSNILVGADPRSPVLVDLDSCQVGDFRCPVGMVPFLAPRLLGAHLADVSRTFEDECFAISTLLFMVLVPGKPPYSHQGGGDPAENIRTGRFPYRTTERGGDETPQGPWALIWAHLPQVLKTLFDGVFSSHEVVGPTEWRAALEGYRYSLLSGHSTLDIFPTQPAPARAGSAPTRSCNAPPSAVRLPARGPAHTAPPRLDPSTFHTCKDCYATFEFTASESDWFARRGFSRPLRCIACREVARAERAEPSTFHTCHGCYATFEFTARDARYFASRALCTPRRCVACRRAKRAS